MDIAGNIRRLREQAGMTQEEVAERLGRTRATVTQWETGWSQPRVGMLPAIADVLGVSVRELLEDDGGGMDAAERHVLDLWRSMSVDGQAVALDALEGIAGRFPRERGEVRRSEAA